MWQYLALLTEIGLVIVISILTGVTVGYYLDRFIGTRFVFTLAFLLVGIASGFVSAYRLVFGLEKGGPNKQDKG